MKNLMTLTLILMVATSQAAVLDGLAAKVNDNVITVGDVMNEIKRNRHELEKGADLTDVYSNTVERLIDRRLILAAAAVKKLDMQEWLVDNRIREIVKDGFEGDMNKLNLMLAEAKVPMTDWRNEIRDDMIISAMRYQIIDKNIVATPDAMRREYNAHKSRYCSEAQTTVRVILLRPPADEKKLTSISTRGEEILARLEKGEDFAKLARDFSSDSHAKDGGLWENVKPEDAFRPEIASEIAKLKPGEFSRLVNLDGWGFIVRKESETFQKQLSFADAYEQIERNVKRELGQSEYAAWLRRLRAEAFIKIYAIPDESK